MIILQIRLNLSFLKSFLFKIFIVLIIFFNCVDHIHLMQFLKLFNLFHYSPFMITRFSASLRRFCNKRWVFICSKCQWYEFLPKSEKFLSVLCINTYFLMMIVFEKLSQTFLIYRISFLVNSLIKFFWLFNKFFHLCVFKCTWNSNHPRGLAERWKAHFIFIISLSSFKLSFFINIQQSFVPFAPLRIWILISSQIWNRVMWLQYIIMIWIGVKSS